MILLIGILVSAVTTFCLVLTDFSWPNILVGTCVSLALMWVFRREITPRPLAPVNLSFHLLLYTPVLFYYLLIDILKGTWQVAMTTLGIYPVEHPGIVKVPLGAHSRYGIGPVGFFITLSPGSFMVDIDWDEHVMLIHVLDASNPDQIRRDAEKYYRLWEYGPYKPLDEPNSERPEQPHA